MNSSCIRVVVKKALSKRMDAVQTTGEAILVEEEWYWLRLCANMRCERLRFSLFQEVLENVALAISQLCVKKKAALELSCADVLTIKQK